jgi:hypothetical protein
MFIYFDEKDWKCAFTKLLLTDLLLLQQRLPRGSSDYFEWPGELPEVLFLGKRPEDRFCAPGKRERTYLRRPGALLLFQKLDKQINIYAARSGEMSVGVRIVGRSVGVDLGHIAST